MWLVSLRLMYYLGLLFGDCIFLSLHTYLQLNSTCTIQWFAVFASGPWFAACALFFCTFPRIAFCSYLSLTQSVFVSAYLYQPVCHKFRICIFIQFNFINLFIFYLQIFYYSDCRCNPLYKTVVCNPLVCHSYSSFSKLFLSIYL